MRAVGRHAMMGEYLVAGALGLLWLGFCGFVALFAIEERSWLVGIGSATLLTLGVGFSLMLYAEANDPSPTIALKERDWACTDHDVILVPILVGKVIINQPRKQCVEWRRN